MNWLDKVSENRDLLTGLISRYHPLNLPLNREEKMVITAPNAELACSAIRQEIQEGFPENPQARFDAAISRKDIPAVYDVLSEVWFGVPESTSCWSIPGFSLLVNLLEDPPEENS